MLQRPKISSLDLFFAPTTSLKNVNLGKTGNGQDIKQQIVEKLNSEREPYFLWHQCQRVDSFTTSNQNPSQPVSYPGGMEFPSECSKKISAFFWKSKVGLALCRIPAQP